MSVAVKDIEGYLAAGKAAGCPADQMVNLLKASCVLWPKQLVASAKARECDRPDGPTKLGFGGSRGPGKSFWLLSQMGLDDCQRYPGLKCLLLRKIGKTNKEAFDDLSRRLFTTVRPHFIQRPTPMGVFGNGSRIILGNFKDEKDIENYLGIEYDVIGIEESTTLSDKKKRDIRGSLRTSKLGWRPREYHTTNPGGLSHAQFKREFVLPWRARAETDTRFIPATIDDNPSVNKEYRKTLEGYSGWQRRAWLEGDWDIESGQYFTNFRYEDHVYDADVRGRFELPTTWDVWCSLDHGLTHYTVVHLFARSDDGHIWVLDEHCERNWVPEQHAEAIHAMLARWDMDVKRLKFFVAGHDCFSKIEVGGEIGTRADQYLRCGITLTRANVDRANGALELFRRLGNRATRNEEKNEKEIPPTITILENCPGLIACIPYLQRDPTRPEDVMKVDCDPDTGEGGDDFYDCARYGIMQFSASRSSNSSSSVVGPRRDFTIYVPR